MGRFAISPDVERWPSKPPKLVNKLGRWSASLEMLTDMAQIGYPLFHYMIVYEAKLNGEDETVEYLAYHPSFKLLGEFDEVPSYEAHFNIPEYMRGSVVSPALIFPKWVPKDGV